MRKIYKLIIAKKLGSGIIFPRKILYVRQNTLGVRLIIPSTAITIQSTKPYLDNKRAKTRIGRLI